MTREQFIKKWLRPEKPYSEETKEEMRADLDKLIRLHAGLPGQFISHKNKKEI